jgi:hypothetical protein
METVELLQRLIHANETAVNDTFPNDIDLRKVEQHRNAPERTFCPFHRRTGNFPHRLGGD